MQMSPTSGHDSRDEQSITPVHTDETGSVDVAQGPSEYTSQVAEEQLGGEGSVSSSPSTFHTGEISTGQAGPTVYPFQQPEQPTNDEHQDKREDEGAFVEADAGCSAASRVDATTNLYDSPVCICEEAQFVAEGVPSSHISNIRPPVRRGMSSIDSLLSPLPPYSSCRSPIHTTIPDTHGQPAQDSTMMRSGGGPLPGEYVLSRASGAQQVRPTTQRFAPYPSQQVAQPRVQVGTVPRGHIRPGGLTVQTDVTPSRVFPTNDGSVTPTAPPAYRPRSPDTEAYDSVYGDHTHQSRQPSSQDLVEDADAPLLFEGELDPQEESQSDFPPDRKA